MNYNYLIAIIFVIFFNLKLEIKKIIFLIIILSYFLYNKKLEYDQNNDKIKLYPELKNLDNELINFYFDNIYLIKFDSVNFYESLNYTKIFLDLHNTIKDSPMKYYHNDILNKYKLKSLKSFENIQYSLPLNKEVNKGLINKIKLLNKILSKYKLKFKENEKVNIYTKYDDKILAFNF
jgi:hypothetical protein